MQDIEATIVSGNGTETGQIITTAIGGRDGKPKQVITSLLLHMHEFRYLEGLLALFGRVHDIL